MRVLAATVGRRLLVVLGSMRDSRSLDQVRNSSCPRGGIPTIRAITVEMMGEANSLTYSTAAAGLIFVRYSSTVDTTMGSRPATYRGVKNRLTSARSCLCRGGSIQERLPARNSLNAEFAGNSAITELENAA